MNVIKKSLVLALPVTVLADERVGDQRTDWGNEPLDPLPPLTPSPDHGGTLPLDPLPHYPPGDRGHADNNNECGSDDKNRVISVESYLNENNLNGEIRFWFEDLTSFRQLARVLIETGDGKVDLFYLTNTTAAVEGNSLVLNGSENPWPNEDFKITFREDVVFPCLATAEVWDIYLGGTAPPLPDKPPSPSPPTRPHDPWDPPTNDPPGPSPVIPVFPSPDHGDPLPLDPLLQKTDYDPTPIPDIEWPVPTPSPSNPPVYSPVPNPSPGQGECGFNDDNRVNLVYHNLSEDLSSDIIITFTQPVTSFMQFGVLYIFSSNQETFVLTAETAEISPDGKALVLKRQTGTWPNKDFQIIMPNFVVVPCLKQNEILDIALNGNLPTDPSKPPPSPSPWDPPFGSPDHGNGTPPLYPPVPLSAPIPGKYPVETAGVRGKASNCSNMVEKVDHDLRPDPNNPSRLIGTVEMTFESDPTTFTSRPTIMFHDHTGRANAWVDEYNTEAVGNVLKFTLGWPRDTHSFWMEIRPGSVLPCLQDGDTYRTEIKYIPSGNAEN